MADSAALSTLVGNVDVFFDRYWEQDLLHLRGQIPAVPADLDSIDHLLRDHVLTTSTVTLSADGGRVDPSRYTIDPTTLVTGGDGEQSVVDPDRLLAAFQHGANVVFQRVEDYLPAAAAISNGLTELVGHPVRGNMFFTPPGSPGLPPHRDGADVFVIQCVGVKRWEIWNRDVPRPLCEDRWDDIDHGDPDYVIDLEPGDLLYVPRGWQHRVGAGAETSLSTSFNIRTVTRAHVARAAVDLANKSESLRVALQPESIRDREPRLAEIREILDDLSVAIAAINPADLLDSVDQLTEAVRSPKPSASIKDVINSIGLTDNHRLRLADDVSLEADGLHRGEHHVGPPAPILDALRQPGADVLTVAQLRGGLPLVAAEPLLLKLLADGWLLAA